MHCTHAHPVIISASPCLSRPHPAAAHLTSSHPAAAMVPLCNGATEMSKQTAAVTSNEQSDVTSDAICAYVKTDLCSLNSCHCCRRCLCLAAFLCTWWLWKTWTASQGYWTWLTHFLRNHRCLTDKCTTSTGIKQQMLAGDLEHLQKLQWFDFRGLFKGFFAQYKLRKRCCCRKPRC